MTKENIYFTYTGSKVRESVSKLDQYFTIERKNMREVVRKLQEENDRLREALNKLQRECTYCNDFKNYTCSIHGDQIFSGAREGKE